MTDETASSLNSSAPQKSSISRTVSLVGFMGAGKTTVGRELASRLGWQFIDLDEAIQARAGRTVAEIFQTSGENAFRQLERQVLQQLVQSGPASGWVLSLGGGAFIDNTIQQLLRDNEIPTVFLDAPAEELFRRCGQPGSVRPLLRDRDGFYALYEQRRPGYLKAGLCVQTAGCEIATVVEEIVSRLGLEKYLGA